MYFEVKNTKTKNHWSICTLKCRNNVHVRSLLETKTIKVGSANDFRGFEYQQSCTVDDFKRNFINKFTGESSNESKTVT